MKLAALWIPLVLLCASFSVTAADAPAAPAATHDQLIKDSLAVITEMSAVLVEIKDEASANANKDKIVALSKRMAEINKQKKALGKPSPEEVTKQKETYGKQMEEAITKLTTESTRIAAIPAAQKVLEDATKDLN
jgi:hypothetical protein